MNRLISIGLVLFGLFYAKKSRATTSEGTVMNNDFIFKPSNLLRNRDNTIDPNTWEIPANGKQYATLFRNAEIKYNLPTNLLARIAFQESSFRPDVIYGRVNSSAGAVGIMQIVPYWHPDVDPLNVPEAIDYAGAYIRRLYNKFGSWSEALAAYNWGQGNLRAYGMARLPTETSNYVASITNDINIA